ncbi:Methyl-CpG-binding domain protein 4 [Asimina triloba]
MIEDPFVCEKEGFSCDDPAEIECEPSRLWVFDKPNIPKPPAGFNREVLLRKDFSKFDAHYETPTGKKVRAPAEVEKFLDANPKYRDDGISVSSFNFAVPKITEDMIPIAVRKDFASGNKRSKPS